MNNKNDQDLQDSVVNGDEEKINDDVDKSDEKSANNTIEKRNSISETPDENPLNDKATDKKDKKKKKEKVKPKSEIEKLNDEIILLKKTHEDTLKKKNKELTEAQQKYAYLQAELENTRKHYIRQGEISKAKSKVSVITSFTPLIDSFEMALKTKENLFQGGINEEKLKQFLVGFENLYENLKSVFSSLGVKSIDQINVPFDYKIHDVAMSMINDDLEEDTITHIIQKGYTLNGEVIRPAKVIVSKKTPQAPEPEPIEIEESKNEQKENNLDSEDSKEDKN